MRDIAANINASAEEQQAAITEITSDMIRIAEETENSLRESEKASSVAKLSTRLIEESNVEMNNMLSAMAEIEDSSGKIQTIVKTIEDIAFQTNILALNASVEAARAGEAGKGFAVVADEVRNLASKSAEASNTTNGLIAETVSVIEEGKNLANETAELLSAAVERANLIEKSITEISDVTENQKSQLTGIVSKLGEVSGVVHTTAATAEESAAASEELDKQVEMLNDSLRKYKI